MYVSVYMCVSVWSVCVYIGSWEARRFSVLFFLAGDLVVFRVRVGCFGLGLGL